MCIEFLDFTELLEEFKSFSNTCDFTLISRKSPSLRGNSLPYISGGPPSRAGFKSGSLSVCYSDLEYLQILNSVSAIMFVSFLPTITLKEL